MSDDRRLYLYDSKRNSRSDVDGRTHTKQLLNLVCIVYIFNLFCLLHDPDEASHQDCTVCYNIN